MKLGAFQIVPENEMPEPLRRVSPLAEALVDGKAVFLAGANQSTVAGLRNKGSFLYRSGFRLQAIQGERNGTAGLYLRAVKR